MHHGEHLRACFSCAMNPWDEIKSFQKELESISNILTTLINIVFLTSEKDKIDFLWHEMSITLGPVMLSYGNNSYS